MNSSAPIDEANLPLQITSDDNKMCRTMVEVTADAKATSKSNDDIHSSDSTIPDSGHLSTSVVTRPIMERQSSQRRGACVPAEPVQSVLEAFPGSSAKKCDSPPRTLERQRSERRGAFTHQDLLESAVEASFESISCYGSDPEDVATEKNKVEAATVTPITMRPWKRPRFTHLPIDHVDLNEAHTTALASLNAGVKSGTARYHRRVSS